MKKPRPQRPWLTPSGVEIPTKELREICKSWDRPTWEQYLDWYESARKEALVSPHIYAKRGEEITETVFESHGHQSCPAKQAQCDQLLSELPPHEAEVLRGTYLRGETQCQIGALLNRSRPAVAHIKSKAIGKLRWGIHGELLQTGNDTLDLMRDINRGINDSLHMAETLGLRIDPGIYRDLRKVDEAMSAVEKIYGIAVDSKDAVSQRNTDQTVAEAISFNNELNEYARRLDQIGEEIKRHSHDVSPGGAAKLTAESLGVMIHVMNQQMRATGQGLKLQAQAMAVQNKKEKSSTEQYLKEGTILKTKMISMNPNFAVPRF